MCPGPLQNLLDWTQKPLAEANFVSSIIAVLIQQRIIMNFQVEDFGLSSSNVSWLIQQVMYSILLYTMWQKGSRVRMSAVKKQQDHTEEYDRQKTKLAIHGFSCSTRLMIQPMSLKVYSSQFLSHVCG